MSPARRGRLFRRISQILYLFRPMLGDLRFWGAQCLVLAIAGVHWGLESIDPFMDILYLLPAGLLWIPVVYAAIIFGTPGAIATVMWSVLSAVPEWVVLSNPSDTAELVGMVMLIPIAIILGRLADVKEAARRKAKVAVDYALRVREEERLSIARDIHDHDIQSLVSVCWQLDDIRLMEPDLPAAVTDRLRAIRRLAEQVADHLRDFAKGLRSPVLDDLGMVAATRRMLAELAARAKLQTGLEVAGEEKHLSAETKLSLYRIVQEALRNVENHAKAKQVEVFMTFSNGESTLTICDDGIGFVPPASGHFASEGRYGLLGMSEQAKRIGGRLQIQSTPGKGTRVTLFFPSAPPQAEEMPGGTGFLPGDINKSGGSASG